MVKAIPRTLLALALVSALGITPLRALAGDTAAAGGGTAQNPKPTPRADNHGMLTLNIDFVDSAAGKSSDTLLVAEALMRELGLKRTNPSDPSQSQQVPVRWVPLQDSKECNDPDRDAGIIEVTHAALNNQDMNYFLGGSVLYRAELGFRVLNCRGDILYEYVGDRPEESFRSATLGSVYVSLAGLGGAISLANAHANDKTAAAAAATLGSASTKFPVYNANTQQTRILGLLMKDVRENVHCTFGMSTGPGKFDGTDCPGPKSRRQARAANVATR
ncbi:MAG TPA: hypothetical protein VHS78_11780 [Candidatus Elarobacter sp.]|jgi:hypothetical protein|nr:hypothetical protein [Candidatus Elarobacter sp.]